MGVFKAFPTLTCHSAKQRFAAKHEPPLSHQGRGGYATAVQTLTLSSGLYSDLMKTALSGSPVSLTML